MDAFSPLRSHIRTVGSGGFRYVLGTVDTRSKNHDSGRTQPHTRALTPDARKLIEEEVQYQTAGGCGSSAVAQSA